MQRRIFHLLGAIMLVYALSAGCLLVLRESGLLLHWMGRRLQSIAVTAAAAIDGEDHRHLQYCQDRGCPQYRKWEDFLDRVRRENGLDTEMYTLVLDGDRTRFILRTHPESPVGEPYPLRSEMVPVFRDGGTVLTGLYRDHNGAWLSAYAPIRNGKGQVVALLEADYRAQEFYTILGGELFQLLLLTMGCMGLALWSGRRLASRLTRPLLELVEAMDRAAKTGEPGTLPLAASDEIGMVARTFAAMHESLRQMRQRERLALVGQLAARVFHDLGGMLQIVQGYSDLMAIETEAGQRQKFLAPILMGVRRIRDMAHDVLAFTRGETRLEIREISSRAFLEGICEDLALVATDREVTIQCHDAWQAPFPGDQNKLYRVVFNLAKNAIEASSAGASVEVGMRWSGGGLVLEVMDRGPGVLPEIRGHLFEAFATRGKPSGTGLGLAIARSFVEAHGGSITVEDREGGGTVFRVLLPCRSGDSRTEGQRSTGNPPPECQATPGSAEEPETGGRPLRLRLDPRPG